MNNFFTELNSSTSSIDCLTNFHRRHVDKSDAFDLGEYLDTASPPFLNLLCSHISTLVQTSIESLKPFSKENEISQTHKNNVLFLHAAIVYIRNIMNLSSMQESLNEDLFDAIKSIHNVLNHLQFHPSLQNEVSKLCEDCWRYDLPQKEELIPQTLLFLLHRSLNNKHKTNVDRVYALKDAFLLFDLEDQESQNLKLLLLQCSFSPLYLRYLVGRRFISFLFTLNPQIVRELIVIVKNQIPSCRKSISDAYGDIIFRAWQQSDGACAWEIENTCLSDLVFASIRASIPALAEALRQVLKTFCDHKRETKVEALLFRLTRPLLYRSLQAANPAVRQNTLLLLLQLFPLTNADLSKVEADEHLEKQLAAIERLTNDDVASIRAIASEGVCKILRFYWTIIPSHVIARLLKHVIDDMAMDGSSRSVRSSVLKGLSELVSNEMSHSVLQILLPRLSHLLHDTNLSVRFAFTNLLCTLTEAKVMPFHKIVSPHELLEVLANDHVTVTNNITKLLIPTYFPLTLPIEQSCQRCFSLIRRSPSAGYRFCSQLSTHSTVSSSSLLYLLSFLSHVALSAMDEECGVNADSSNTSSSHVCNPNPTSSTSTMKAKREKEDEAESVCLPVLSAMFAICTSFECTDGGKKKKAMASILSPSVIQILFERGRGVKEKVEVVKMAMCVSESIDPFPFSLLLRCISTFPLDPTDKEESEKVKAMFDFVVESGRMSEMLYITILKFLSSLDIEHGNEKDECGEGEGEGEGEGDVDVDNNGYCDVGGEYESNGGESLHKTRKRKRKIQKENDKEKGKGMEKRKRKKEREKERGRDKKRTKSCSSASCVTEYTNKTKKKHGKKCNKTNNNDDDDTNTFSSSNNFIQYLSILMNVDKFKEELLLNKKVSAKLMSFLQHSSHSLLQSMAEIEFDEKSMETKKKKMDDNLIIIYCKLFLISIFHKFDKKECKNVFSSPPPSPPPPSSPTSPLEAVREEKFISGKYGQNEMLTLLNLSSNTLQSFFQKLKIQILNNDNDADADVDIRQSNNHDTQLDESVVIEDQIIESSHMHSKLIDYRIKSALALVLPILVTYTEAVSVRVFDSPNLQRKALTLAKQSLQLLVWLRKNAKTTSIYPSIKFRSAVACAITHSSKLVKLTSHQFTEARREVSKLVLSFISSGGGDKGLTRFQGLVKPWLPCLLECSGG